MNKCNLLTKKGIQCKNFIYKYSNEYCKIHSDLIEHKSGGYKLFPCRGLNEMQCGKTPTCKWRISTTSKSKRITRAHCHGIKVLKY